MVCVCRYTDRDSSNWDVQLLFSNRFLLEPAGSVSLHGSRNR